MHFSILIQFYTGLLIGNQGNPVLHQNKLYTPNFSKNRIRAFYTVPTTNGADADFVIGQANFTSTDPGTSANRVSNPNTLSIYQNKLAVVDANNHRVLLFNNVPVSTSPD